MYVCIGNVETQQEIFVCLMFKWLNSRFRFDVVVAAAVGCNEFLHLSDFRRRNQFLFVSFDGVFHSVH